jgi:ABC-type sugar transport system ATPase subunit
LNCSIFKKLNSTTLFVTHDQIEALTMADRIAVLDEAHHPNQPSDAYDKPATAVAKLVGFRASTYGAGRQNERIHVCDSGSLAIPGNWMFRKRFCWAFAGRCEYRPRR